MNRFPHNNSFDRRYLFLGVIVIIIIIALIFIGLPKNCYTDQDCFNFKASQCKGVKADLMKDENQLSYHVVGKNNDGCFVEVEMKKVGESQTQEVKDAFQSKQM